MAVLFNMVILYCFISKKLQLGIVMEKHLYFMKPLFGDRERWNLFYEFLISPLHVNSPKSGELLKHMREVLSHETEDIERELCRLTFPDRDPSASGTLNYLRRKLSPLLEHYFEFEAFMSLRADKPLIWTRLIKKACSEKWDKHFEWILEKKALPEIENLSRTEEYFQHKMALADQFDRYAHRKEKDRGKDPNKYVPELEALLNYFSIYLLKLASNQKIQGKIWDLELGEIPLLVPLMKWVEKNWDKTPKLTQMYYLILRSLDSPGETIIYQNLEPLLFGNVLSLPLEDSQAILGHFENLCTLQVNRAKSENDEPRRLFFQEKLRRIIEFQLEKELLFEPAGEEKLLDHGKYKNIVTLFSMEGEFEWVEQFIGEYSGKLMRINQTVAENYGKAILNFQKADFSSANTNIQKALQYHKDKSEYQYALSIRIYLLRILYELGRMEEGLREVEYAKKAIRRNRFFHDDTRKKFGRFAGFYAELCRIRLDVPLRQEKALKALESRILKATSCLSKDWLLAKTREKEKSPQM